MQCSTGSAARTIMLLANISFIFLFNHSFVCRSIPVCCLCGLRLSLRARSFGLFTKSDWIFLVEISDGEEQPNE